MEPSTSNAQQITVKALYFAVFPMNVSLLEVSFEDFDFVCCTVTIHDQNVCVVFNFTETVRPRNLRLLQYYDIKENHSKIRETQKKVLRAKETQCLETTHNT